MQEELRFPLLGQQAGAVSRVFRVLSARGDFLGGCSDRLVELCAPGDLLSSAEVTYDATDLCAAGKQCEFTIFFHPVVYGSCTWRQKNLIQLRVIYCENSFSKAAFSADFPLNGSDKEFELDTRYTVSGHCIMAHNIGSLRIKSGIPLFVFTSLMKLKGSENARLFLTRHIVVLDRSANFARVWLTEGEEEAMKLILDLQILTVNHISTYGFPEEFSKKLSNLLIGPEALQGFSTVIQDFLYFLLWSISSRPDIPNYGEDSYKALCHIYSETADKEQETARLQIATVWATAIREIVEYYSNS